MSHPSHTGLFLCLTCKHLHKHVNDVDDVSSVVKYDPEGEDVVVKRVKRLPNDDEEGVVENGHCYHKQPPTNNRQ